MGLPVQRTGSDNDRLIRYAQDTYGILHRSQGQLFYVDNTDGNDDTDNPGTSPWCPLLTVTRALALCTAGQSDIIQILQHSPSAPHADEDFPISVNKAGVTIRGSYGSGLLSDSGFGSDEQNEACLTIAANYVTIEDLYLGVAGAGTTGSVVDFSGATYGTTFRNVCFDTQRDTIAYAIYSSGDQPYLLVEDCVFGGATSYSTAHIYLSNATFGIIRRNYFRSFTGIAINLPASCTNLGIFDNKFYMPSDTDGKAITLGDGSTNIAVDGNHAFFGTTDPADPYEDLNGAGSDNAWGLNYAGVTATLPKVT